MSHIAEEPEPGVPEWIVTFGDMMSLLLTFFVLLFAMSEVRQTESAALIESMRKQFGELASLEAPLPGAHTPLRTANERRLQLGRARRLDFHDGGDKVQAATGDYPRVQTIRPGQIALGGVVYFGEASDRIAPAEERRLDELVEAFRGKPQKIEVRGHSSTRPLADGSRYESHWDLAYARCFHVMQLLVSKGLEPWRIRIGVAGTYEPIHIAHDPALQAANSRVEVLLLDELVEDLTGTPDEKRARFVPAVAPPTKKGATR